MRNYLKNTTEDPDTLFDATRKLTHKVDESLVALRNCIDPFNPQSEAISSALTHVIDLTHEVLTLLALKPHYTFGERVVSLFMEVPLTFRASQIEELRVTLVQYFLKVMPETLHALKLCLDFWTEKGRLEVSQINILSDLRLDCLDFMQELKHQFPTLVESKEEN